MFLDELKTSSRMLHCSEQSCDFEAQNSNPMLIQNNHSLQHYGLIDRNIIANEFVITYKSEGGGENSTTSKKQTPEIEDEAFQIRPFNVRHNDTTLQSTQDYLVSQLCLLFPDFPRDTGGGFNWHLD